MKQGALSASDDAACSLLVDGLTLLVEQWERRTIAADKMVADAKKTASDETIARLTGKASMVRSMTVELKRVIREANVEAMRAGDNLQNDHTRCSASNEPSC